MIDIQQVMANNSLTGHTSSAYLCVSSNWVTKADERVTLSKS